MTAILRAGLFATLAFVSLPAIAAGQGKPDEALLRRIEQLERRVRELETLIKTEQPRAAAPVASSGNARDLANWRRLRKGMTPDEVRSVLGEPERIDTMTYRSIWHYADYAAVNFDGSSKKVEGWSEPSR